MRKSRHAICRLHDHPYAVGGGATIRALVGGTFSRAKRKGAWPYPESPGKPAEQFAVAHAYDWRRDFCRANRVAVQNRVSSHRNRRAADAFSQVIPPNGNSTPPFWLKIVARK